MTGSSELQAERSGCRLSGAAWVAASAFCSVDPPTQLAGTIVLQNFPSAQCSVGTLDWTLFARKPLTPDVDLVAGTGTGTQNFVVTNLGPLIANPGLWDLWIRAASGFCAGGPDCDCSQVEIPAGGQIAVGRPAQSGDLALFIDIDGDRETDYDSYVPMGRDPISLAPTVIDLVATVPPEVAACTVGEEVTFSLSETTQYRGYATNKGTSLENDFELAVGFVAALDDEGFASVPLTVTDWGGSTAAAGSLSALFQTSLTIPRDVNGNGIADAVWTATDGITFEVIDDSMDNIEPCADDETNPVGRGRIGDGIQAFDEYRGFIVRNTHRRTNPNVKDRFVAVEPLSYGFGCLNDLATWDHWIYVGELDAAHVVNVNRRACGSGLSPVQKGVVVEFKEELHPGIFGETHCPGVPFCTPLTTLYCRVFLQTIRSLSPPTLNNLIASDPADSVMVSKTKCHESGHSSGLDHYSYPGLPNHSDCAPPPTVSCGPASVMATSGANWLKENCFSQPCSPLANYWANTPTSFDAFDQSLIQLVP